MRQSVTTQSSIQTTQPRSRADSLHPTLQTALANLDVQLEEELIRYRRHRALGRVDYKPRQAAHRKVAKALELIPVSEPSDRLPTPSNPFGIGNFDPTSETTPFAAIALTTEPTAPSSQELKELAKQYASQVAAESDLNAATSNSPDDYLESSEELLRTLSQEEATVQAEQSFMQNLLTPLGVGSMLLLLLSSAMFGFVVMNPSSISQLFADRNSGSRVSSQPDQQSLTESGDLAGVPQPNLANQEFPELNLDTLGSIKVESGVPAPTPDLAASTKSLPKSKLSTSNKAEITKPAIGPATPGLTASEPAPVAGDVPSPRKLAPSTSYNAAPVRSYTPPEPADNPPPARRYDPPVRSYIPPVAPPVVNVAPTPTKPFQPRPKTTPPVGDRTPPPPSTNASSPGRVTVVSPYSGDSALEAARQKVPDAYLKNHSDGAKIQLGAYQDEATAKAQAEELRKQGIPAEVYKP